MELPTETRITSHRPITGRFIVLYKKFIKLLIGPYLKTVFEAEYQIIHQVEGKINQVEGKINGKLRYVDNRQNEVEALTAELIKRMDSITILLNQRQNEITHQQDELAQRQNEITHQYESIRNKVETLRYRFEDSCKVNKNIGFNDNDYMNFENRFRGNREDIKKRQGIYLPIFYNLTQSDYILDIGCGRGEFLELLMEKKINAKGIDFNSAMISHCKKNGLDAEEAKALDYLSNIEDSSVGGIVAYQLIEHLPAKDLILLVKLSHKKLKPGGYLILETPNPTCLSIFSGSFYVDPTHIRPVHPELLKYVLEVVGFNVTDTWFVNKSGDDLSLSDTLVNKEVQLINENFRKLNSVLYGAPDYAVIARRVK